MLYILASSIFGILIFLFIFWKKLREDYAVDIVFKTAFYILFGILLGSILVVKFLPDWFFLAGLLGGVLGLIICNFTMRIKFYEILEAFVIGTLPGLSLVFLTHSVLTSSFSSFIAFISILFMIFIYYYLDTRYKTFVWYKSGKIGFSGLTTMTIIFIIRGVLAVSGIHVLSFVNNYEVLISFVFAGICLLMLTNLGKSK